MKSGTARRVATTGGLSLWLHAAAGGAYAAYDAALQSAYAAVVSPQTGTPVAVRMKDEARRGVQHEAARLAVIIGAQETVSDGQLIALGLVPRPTRAARRAPETAPVVDIAAVVGRVVTVRPRASSAGGARMPAGCIGAFV